MEFNGATLTRNNEVNVRVEMMNTRGEQEVYSVLFDDESNKTLNRISVRRGQKADGNYKWGTLNARVHYNQISNIMYLVKQSKI